MLNDERKIDKRMKMTTMEENDLIRAEETQKQLKNAPQCECGKYCVCCGKQIVDEYYLKPNERPESILSHRIRCYFCYKRWFKEN